ncbi:MAG: hypothetical protein IIZ08_09435 [Clostridia bacterium]|nr:hypothetical protein [Clostridia bacterium]
MKGNRQIGLDGRIFINDCLSDGIFFVYSMILSGILGATGDIMKLLGKSSATMDSLTNGLIIMDLACCLGLVLVSYYIYFMNCGENMPRFGVKPLIYLEYVRLAYYGMLIYDILYRFSDEILHSGRYPVSMSIFYAVYLGWLIACAFAAMFILTVLNQNMIRRSYSFSFKMLALIGLAINIALPLVFFITRIWVKGGGDGFYSSGVCDFIRLGIAPIFYAALWFLFLNAIDQIDRVFNEVDNAIRDKNYRIEFDNDDESRPKKKKKTDKPDQSQKDKSAKKSKSKKKKKKTGSKSKADSKLTDTAVVETQASSEIQPEASDSIGEIQETEQQDDIGGVVDINQFFNNQKNDSPSDEANTSESEVTVSDENQTAESADNK